MKFDTNFTDYRKISRVFSRVRASLHNLPRSLPASTGRVGSFYKNHEGLSKAAVSVAVVLAIVAGLWTASPVQALNITFPSLPSGTLGSAHTFQVKVSVEDIDLLPIKSIDVGVSHSSKSAYTFGLTNLSLVTGSENYTTAAGAVKVDAVTGAGWGYGYASAPRYGYGYGYSSGSVGYGYGTGYGYGYGYNSYLGATDITYTITWTPPSDWSGGTYEVQVLVNVNGGAVITTSTPGTFTLRAPITGGGAPADPDVTDVSGSIDESGVFTEEVIAESADGEVTITIDDGVKGLTAAGEALSEISIEEAAEADIPTPPTDGHIIGLTYDFGPDGATFDAPVTVTLSYDPDALPAGVNEADLIIGRWDADASVWIELTSVVDTENNTVTATISHFTLYAIIVPTPVEEAEVAPTPVEEEEEVEEAEVAPTPVEEEEEEEEEEGLAWWIWLIIGLGSAVIIALPVYFLWWKQRSI